MAVNKDPPLHEGDRLIPEDLTRSLSIEGSLTQFFIHCNQLFSTRAHLLKLNTILSVLDH